MNAITVLGVPAGQGNLKANRRGKLYHANDKELRAWRTAVRQAAIVTFGKPGSAAYDAIADALGAPTSYSWMPHPTGPVGLHVVITVPALKKPKPWPVTRSSSDADHYLRAIGDALSGVAYADDSQICDARIQVAYPGPPGLDQPGAVIRIWSLEES